MPLDYCRAASVEVYGEFRKATYSEVALVKKELVSSSPYGFAVRKNDSSLQ